MDAKNIIAKRVAQELKDGDTVNLGIGVPTLVGNYLPEGISIMLQSENGFLGIGPAPQPGKEDKDLINAGGQYCTMVQGGSFFDEGMSFCMIRGGHLDCTVLGALQVDSEGSIANWTIPGVMVPGMGGAMDLVVGAKRVIVAMEHTSRGEPKILDKCTLPLTAAKVVDTIVTELGLFSINNGKMVLKEIAQGVTLDDIKAVTPATYTVDPNLKEMII